MKRGICILLVCALLLAGCSASKKDWQEQYDLGMRYLDEEDYENAILAFSAAIEIDPKRPEAYMGRAEAYIAIEEPDKALRDYKKAQKLAREEEDDDLDEELKDLIAELEELIEEWENRKEDMPEGSGTGEPYLATISIYNQGSLWQTFQLEYEDSGSLTRITETLYDGMGGVIGSCIYRYRYDSGNLLAEVICDYPDLYTGEIFDSRSWALGYNSEGVLTDYYDLDGCDVHCSYDEQGQRTLKALHSDYTWETSYNYYDGMLFDGYTDCYDASGTLVDEGYVAFTLDESGRVIQEDTVWYYREPDHVYYRYFDGVMLRETQGETQSLEIYIQDVSGQSRWVMRAAGYDSAVTEDGRVMEVISSDGTTYVFGYLQKYAEQPPTDEKGLNLYKPAEYEIIRQDRSYYDEDGVLRLEHYYDQVVLLGSGPEIAAVNALITADMNGFLFEDPEESMNIYLENQMGRDCYFLTASAEVTNNADGILSICITEKMLLGGVGTLNYRGLSYDLKTGSEVELAELFRMTEAEMTLSIKDAAWAYLSTYHADAMWESSKETLYSYTLEDFYYYFRDGELILTFPTYSISYGAAGAFTVPTGLYY